MGMDFKNLEMKILKEHTKKHIYLFYFAKLFSVNLLADSQKNDDKTTAEIWNKLSKEEINKLGKDFSIKKVLGEIISDVVKDEGIDAPDFSLEVSHGILKKQLGSANRVTGEIKIYKQKYSIFNRKTLGLNIGELADSVAHECQHLKQVAYTSNFFAGVKDIPNKYKLMAVLEGMHIIDDCFIGKNSLSRKLNEFENYYYDMAEIDSRIAGVNYLVKLVQNEYISKDVKNKLLSHLKNFYKNNFAPQEGLPSKFLFRTLALERKLYKNGLGNIEKHPEGYFLLEDFNDLKPALFNYAIYLSDYCNNLRNFIKSKEKEKFDFSKISDEKIIN